MAKKIRRMWDRWIDWSFGFVTNAITYEKRADGSDGSILRYNFDYAMTIGWFIPRRGSTFTFKEQILLSGGVSLLCTVLALGSCPMNPNEHKRPYCISLPAPSTNYLTLMTLCSFVVAFFANTMIQRWWAIRMHIQSIIGNSNQLVMKIMSIITVKLRHGHNDVTTSGKFTNSITSEKRENSNQDILLSNKNLTMNNSHRGLFQINQEIKRKQYRSEAEQFVKTITGLLILTYRMLFNLARESSHVTDLLERDIITVDQVDFFQSIGPYPLHGCSMILMLIHEAVTVGVLTNKRDDTDLDESLAQIRSHCANVLMYIQVQLPFPFIQIVSAVAYAFMVQLIFVCSAYIAEGFQKKDQASLAAGYLTIILYTFVLLGLLRLYAVLSNPLGEDHNDFPGNTLMKTYEDNLLEILRNGFAFADSDFKFGIVENGVIKHRRPSQFITYQLPPVKTKGVNTYRQALNSIFVRNQPPSTVTPSD